MKRTMALVVSLAMVFTMLFTFNVAGATTIKSEAKVKTDILFGKGGAGFTGYYADTEGGYYDLKATVDMTEVNEAMKTLIQKTTEEKAKAAEISGSFELKITFDGKIDVPTPSAASLKYDIDGNESEFAKFFTVPTDSDITFADDVLTVEVNVKSGLKGLDVYDFAAGKSLIGNVITITGSDVVAARYFDVFTVTGSATGKTLITGTDAEKEYEVTYNFVDKDTNSTDITANLEIRNNGGNGGGGGGGSRPSYRPGGSTVVTPVTPTTNKKVKFEVGSGNTTTVSDISVAAGAKVDLTKVNPGTREGFAFKGWSVNGKIETEITVKDDTVVKAKWVNLVAPAEFNSTDHFAYMHGYPDGEVKPAANITREEVATIIYRLLSDAKKAEIAATDNNFSDVDSARWSNEAVSTLAKGGYINGYEDGTFKPANPITRGEFAAIIARFITGTAADAGYNDTKGHWAADAVNKVVDKAWVEGYEDGSFRPDANITRAEVATIVNRMLVRYTDAHNDSQISVSFPDNHAYDWYYYAIIEATNGHEKFQRRDNGYDENWGVEAAPEAQVEPAEKVEENAETPADETNAEVNADENTEETPVEDTTDNTENTDETVDDGSAPEK